MEHPIISVHVPKVGGTSFLQHIKREYGEHNVLLDYSDDPVDVRCRMNIDPDYYRQHPIVSIAPYCVVHGHFHAGKYEYMEHARRITFLRHPVDNVLSIYRYWTVHHESAFAGPVFKYFKMSNLSIEALAMLPKIRFLYSETYFGGIDMTRFHFVGDYSKYDRELMRLGALLGVNFSVDVRVNVTRAFPGGDCIYTPDAKTRTALEKILAQDIRFYEQHAGR